MQLNMYGTSYQQVLPMNTCKLHRQYSGRKMPLRPLVKPCEDALLALGATEISLGLISAPAPVLPAQPDN